MRQIVFRDGVFFDMEWNAITPTLDELTAITETVAKYTIIAIGDIVGKEAAL